MAVMTKNKGTIAVVSSHTPSLIWFRMEMMQEFRNRGYDVYAIGNEPEEIWRAKFADSGIVYRQVTLDRNGTSVFRDLFTVISYIRLFRQIKPQKVFLYQAKPIIYGGLALKLVAAKEVYPLVAGLGSLFIADSLKQKLTRHILIFGYKISFKNAKLIFFHNKDDVEVLKQYHILHWINNF